MSPPRTANSRGSAASTRQSSTGHAPDSAVRHGAGPLIRQSGTGRAPLLLASVRAAIASLQSVSVERTVHVACVCYAGAMGPHAAVRSEVCVAWCARPHALWLHICRTRAHENSEGEGVRCQSLQGACGAGGDWRSAGRWNTVYITRMSQLGHSVQRGPDVDHTVRLQPAVTLLYTVTLN